MSLSSTLKFSSLMASIALIGCNPAASDDDITQTPVEADAIVESTASDSPVVTAENEPEAPTTPDSEADKTIAPDILPTQDEAGIWGLGDVNAPIQIEEYASWTCHHCLQVHEDVIPSLKEDYIKTGKVRLVYNDFPTAPVEVSIAGSMLTRCVPPENRYAFIDRLFEEQTAVISIVQNGGDLDGKIRSIASDFDIEDAEFDSCLSDEALLETFIEDITAAEALGVNSTPTLFVNGQRLQGTAWRSETGMATLLDGLLEETEQ